MDARWLRTGIGRYILTLLQGLKQWLPETRLTCITLPADVATISRYCDRVVQLDCSIYSAMEQARLPLIAPDAAVFCAPHYNVPVFRKGPLAVTIHDLTHLLFSGYKNTLRARLYAEPMLRIAANRASHIVTPSDYTRQMLVRRLHADPAKVSVIPCVVGDAFRLQDKQEAADNVLASHGISGPYILYVGSTAPHKNLEGLLVAYRSLCKRHRDSPQLVLVLPKDPYASRMTRRFGTLMAMPGVRYLTAVTDRSLAALYAAALMTVMPSFEEGFGLPVMESMACGTPVVCSNAGSLPEIAGDDAIYFAPDSTEQITSAIERLLYSDASRRRLSIAGPPRAAKYSAGRAAWAYASMLSSIIGEQG
jgi:glycosyltransferase involved in cell wall biosynthesis